jgi:hypothetical protein
MANKMPHRRHRARVVDRHDAIFRRRTLRLPKAILLATGLFLTVGVSAYAGSVTFTFDAVTINGTTINGLAAGATYSQIQTYMNKVLAASEGTSTCSLCVTVMSSGNSGAVADQTYNGEGHVVGPGTGATKSLTLGDSNGATSNSSTTPSSTYDTFIANTGDCGGGCTQNGSTSATTNQITLQFSSGVSVTSFDYEIFPCATGGTCTAPPGLTFEAGNNSNGTDATVKALTGVTPSSTGADGSSIYSPDDPQSGHVAETNSQAIGTWTGSTASDKEFDFVDWPATIGIDNLTISNSTLLTGGSSPVPEPASIALLGTLIFFVTKKLRKV